MTPPGLITTRFTASSTAEEVLRGIDLNGVHAIVTGASSGLGSRGWTWRTGAR